LVFFFPFPFQPKDLPAPFDLSPPPFFLKKALFFFFSRDNEILLTLSSPPSFFPSLPPSLDDLSSFPFPEEARSPFFELTFSLLPFSPDGGYESPITPFFLIPSCGKFFPLNSFFFSEPFYRSNRTERRSATLPTIVCPPLFFSFS